MEAAEGDDDEIKREQDACPEVNLEERPAEKELSWMVDEIAEEGHF